MHSHSNPNTFFGSSLLSNTSSNQANNYSLLGNQSLLPNTSTYTPPQYNLGLNLQLPTVSPSLLSQLPSMSTPTAFNPLPVPAVSLPHVNIAILPENPAKPDIGFATEMGKQSTVLPSAINLGVAVSNAATTGKQLANNITQAQNQGQSDAEAYTCQITKTVAEELSGTAMKGYIMGGIPALVTAAIVNPAFIPAIPIAAAALPSAHANAGYVAKVVGNASEQVCHDAFAAAREYSSRGSKP